VIVGGVTNLELRVEVTIRLPGQLDRVIEFVVDTGFEGQLALPPTSVASLGLPYSTRLWANLADNSDIPVDGFDAEIVWSDQERVVTVLAMGRRPLLGTELLQGFNLSADFEDDGELVLTPL
jgi:clan AA aspartic protease